jgi:hypothetical protein
MDEAKDPSGGSASESGAGHGADAGLVAGLLTETETVAWPPLKVLVGLFLVALAVVTCVTLMWLAVHTVMQIATPSAGTSSVRVTSDDVPWLWIVPISIITGVFLVMAHAVLAGAAGGFNLLLPLWSALFLSLGWNFLEIGFYPAGGGTNWGMLITGAVFVLMGAAPLAGALARGSDNLFYISERSVDGRVDESATLRFRILYASMHLVALAGGILLAVFLFGKVAGTG